nr:basic proline-rich protein-like [Camelus dromedarius]
MNYPSEPGTNLAAEQEQNIKLSMPESWRSSPRPPVPALDLEGGRGAVSGAPRSPRSLGPGAHRPFVPLSPPGRCPPRPHSPARSHPPGPRLAAPLRQVWAPGGRAQLPCRTAGDRVRAGELAGRGAEGGSPPRALPSRRPRLRPRGSPRPPPPPPRTRPRAPAPRRRPKPARFLEDLRLWAPPCPGGSRRSRPPRASPRRLSGKGQPGPRPAHPVLNEPGALLPAVCRLLAKTRGPPKSTA